jgi:hypothetical protein
MATECYSQLGFGFQPKLVVDFTGGTLTTDAGLLLVREFDEQLGLSADVVSRVTDARDARYVTHDVATLLRQRLYQIAAGYEDVNDADRLRHDPAFQVVAGDGRAALGSQPTLSRLENAVEWPEIHRLARVGVDWFCAYAYGPDAHPADLVLDLDSTDDPTHGTQQLALFHGWYDQHMYHPLVWFEGRTGLLLRTRLRPGRDPSAACVVEDLRYLLPPLRRRFPHTPIFLRGDAGMATPAVEAKLEAEGIRYVLGIGTNRVFKARVAALVAKAQARYDRTGRPVYIRTSFRHRAKTWPRHRRILVKIDVTAQGLNVRFMVTNRRGAAADLIARRRTGSKNSNWTSTPTASAVIGSAPTRSDCNSTASPCCCSPTSGARSSQGRTWPRRPSAPSASSCLKSRDAYAGASDASGFISRPIGRANDSSPRVIARWPARRRNGSERDMFFQHTTRPAGGVSRRAIRDTFTTPRPPANAVVFSRRPGPHIDDDDFHRDGSVTSSFVNNAG